MERWVAESLSATNGWKWAKFGPNLSQDVLNQIAAIYLNEATKVEDHLVRENTSERTFIVSRM